MTEPLKCRTCRTGVERGPFDTKTPRTYVPLVPIYRGCSTCRTHIHITVVMYTNISPPIYRTRSTVRHLPVLPIPAPQNCRTSPSDTRPTPVRHMESYHHETNTHRDRISQAQSAQKDPQNGRTQGSDVTDLGAVLRTVPILGTTVMSAGRSVWRVSTRLLCRQADVDHRSGHVVVDGRIAAKRNQTCCIANAHPIQDGRMFAVCGEVQCTK